ncbi:hypothetical protein M2277_005023 [Paenibacillus sp. LBL]|uniref:DUF7662 domain-containing protein n=1 Tax=Paenibacillus sp. LBL TaxID=2940563 RepID=UPI002474C337|nr:hypothetical protein [Paenibacillus sp. LBL]MDH6674331.1 hypothetical protein [Paenibacillus sp. LBL]
MKKYQSLNQYLEEACSKVSEITLTDAKIEEIIDDKLPPSSKKDKRWWTNTEDKVQGQSWLYAGWKVKRVDMNKMVITFVRSKNE